MVRDRCRRSGVRGLFLILVCTAIVSCTCADKTKTGLSLNKGYSFRAVKNESGKWGVMAKGSDTFACHQQTPVQIELYKDDSQIKRLMTGYDSMNMDGQSIVGEGLIKVNDSVSLSVKDKWTANENVLTLQRSVSVKGADPQAFMSGMTFDFEDFRKRSDIEYFVPGMIYGPCEHLTPSAIGGCDTFQSGTGNVWIREDRMPAPVFGIRFADSGKSIAILNPKPDGTTTLEDSQDSKVITLVDENFQFGALGAELANGKLNCGFWFPGTEGEATYLGNTYPDGQRKLWRRRYHPLKDGLTQTYVISFKFSEEPSFPEFAQCTWRWAWESLNPPVVKNDLDAVRTSMCKTLADQVDITDGRAVLPNYITATPKDPYQKAKKGVFGFTGKNLESAYFLIKNSYMPDNGDAERQLKLGRQIIDTFTTLKMNPPVGEGFDIPSGKPALAGPRRGDSAAMYLRSFGDGMKVATRAYLFEKQRGVEHAQWLNWLVSFGDWLLTKQGPDGSFPRTFTPVTGEARNLSKLNTYNVVPFLVLLNKATGDAKYMDAALKAANFSWFNGHDKGIFIGGTIDNPNIIDKEAGTLSLEAYLTVYEATKDPVWLKRAQMAADFSETWIYIWNVPMPADEDDSKLHWKKGVSTIGIQLIATGHSLVDPYMGFEADEYAKLWAYTKDAHYYDVAAILLNNTKNMISLPDRPYDLNGPGWMQEHWSFAPPRGYGLHRGWLPWVTCSQLNGIFQTMDFDKDLYNKLKAGEKPAKSN